MSNMSCGCVRWSWGNSLFKCCFQCCSSWPNTQPVHRVWRRVWRHRPPPRPVHRPLQLWRSIWVRHVLDSSGNRRLCSRGPRFYCFQATARAPYPSQRGSCWASWRRTKEMDGWGSWEAAARRALYLRLMSVVVLKAVCHAFLSESQRRETKAINHSARDSRRLTGTISTAWSYKALYEWAQHMLAYPTIVAWCYIFMSIYIHSLDFPAATFYYKVKFFFPLSGTIMWFFFFFVFYLFL